MNYIELAKQVGFQTDNAGVWVDDGYIDDQLEALCKLVAAHEREACAKVVEDLFVPPDEIADFIVEKILARGRA